MPPLEMMVPTEQSYEALTLKAVTFRLSSTPVQGLPKLVPRLSCQLSSCASLFVPTPETSKNNGSEISVQIHKLRTRISSLLQDRTAEGRWAGVVMAKSAVEAGSREILQGCAPWVRAMLSLLNKPDPTVTKKLCIITVTRIFVLTRSNSTLVRDIATPNLPTFVGSCIQLLNVSNFAGVQIKSLSKTILASFSLLVARHTTIFRSYVTQITALVLPHLAPCKLSMDHEQPSEDHLIDRELQELARHVYVQLLECTPKNAAADAWEVQLKHVITIIHETADQVFRSVIEDWVSSASSAQRNTEAPSVAPARAQKDSIELSPWYGLVAGSERIIGLLQLLKHHLSAETSHTVSANIGALMDLLQRLFSVARPPVLRDWETSSRADSRFERKEREELALILPRIHVVAVEVASAFVGRFGQYSISVLPQLLDLTVWVFGREKMDAHLRISVYELISQMMPLIGGSLSNNDVSSLCDVIKACCNELLPTQSAQLSDLPPMTTIGEQNKVSKQGSAVSFGFKTFGYPAGSCNEAWELLSILLIHLSAEATPKHLRATMERTAIVTQHRDAILSSLQNSSSHNASILPMFARLCAEDLAVQALLRPRMPIFSQRPTPGREIQQDGEQVGLSSTDWSEEVEEYQPPGQSVESPQSNSPEVDLPAYMPSRIEMDNNEPAQTQNGWPGGAQVLSEQVEATVAQPEPFTKRTTAAKEPGRPAKRVRTDKAPKYAPSQLAPPMQRSPATIKSSANFEGADHVDSAVRSPPSPPRAAVVQPLGTFVSSSGEQQLLEQMTGSEDDDDDFEIPPLVIGRDSDDEEA